MVFYTSILHSTVNLFSKEVFASNFDAVASDGVFSSLCVQHEHMVHVACALCTHVHFLA